MRKDFIDKLFYSIGDVSQITKIKPHVLRYWESEFKILNLEKSKSGERIYRKKDIELILKIKYLLYEERYTIEGAKRRLQKDNNLETPSDIASEKKKYNLFLSEIKVELQNLLKDQDE